MNALEDQPDFVVFTGDLTRTTDDPVERRKRLSQFLLLPYSNVTVFYGHIHQEHHFVTGHIAHHSAKSLKFPLPAPGSVPKRKPIPWDAAAPYRGLGFREVDAEMKEARFVIAERPVLRG